MQASHIKIAIVALLIIVGVGYLVTKDTDTGSKAITAEERTEIVAEKSTIDAVPSNDAGVSTTE